MRRRQKLEQVGRSEESVARIERLLSTIVFEPGGGVSLPIVVELGRTEAFGQEDRAGTDLRLVLAPEFAEFAGINELGIQSKSSEAGVEQFANTGKKKFGRTGQEWRRIGRVILNGQWADGSIVTDFLVQLMNLMGIYGDEEEMHDFISCFDEETQATYRRHFLQIEQYRCHLLAWIAGKPRSNAGGKLFFYDL